MIKSVKFEIKVSDKFNSDEFVPNENEYVNFNDLKLVDITKCIDEIENKIIEIGKEKSKKMNMSEEKISQEINKLDMMFSGIKAGVNIIKEKSLIDLISMYMNSIYQNSISPSYYPTNNNYYYTPYENYRNVKPPAYNY